MKKLNNDYKPVTRDTHKYVIGDLMKSKYVRTYHRYSVQSGHHSSYLNLQRGYIYINIKKN